MKICTETKLSPEQVAEAIWALDSEEQAQMFAELRDQAGSSHTLMMQFLACRDECEKLGEKAIGAFQDMFASAYKYMW